MSFKTLRDLTTLLFYVHNFIIVYWSSKPIEKKYKLMKKTKPDKNPIPYIVNLYSKP